MKLFQFVKLILKIGRALSLFGKNKIETGIILMKKHVL